MLHQRAWKHSVNFCLPILLVPTLLSICPAYGQQVVSSTLYGTVTDQTGAAIAGASLTAENVQTGVHREARADSTGSYRLPGLDPGHYTLRVTHEGFTSKALSGIVLEVNQEARVDVQLSVGTVTSEVTVEGRPPIVETSTASVGTVVEEREVQDLPLNLRYVEALATLVPGAAPDPAVGYAVGAGGAAIGGSPFGTESYTAGGGRDSSNTLLIDGMESRAWSTGGIALEPPPDAVQEFKIQTNVYDAAFGKTAGSTMNLVSRSGTNQFRGDLYEFLRNDKFDARNFFAVDQVNPLTGADIPGTARPEFRRNNFGGTVGGPIRKDKTFFFGYYDGLRQIQGLSLPNAVPTAQEAQGNFSSFLTGQQINLCGSNGPANLKFDSGQLFYPATDSLFTCPGGSGNAGSTILVGQPIPGNILTTIDPAGAKALTGFPAPNRAGYPNFVNQNPLVRTDDQFGIRLDNTFGPQDRMFGRYLFAQSSFISPASGYTTLPGFGDKLYFRGQNVAVGWTHSFSSQLLNEATVGFSRNNPTTLCEECPRAPGFVASFGIKNLAAPNPSLEGFPFFSFVNFGGVGDSNYRPVSNFEQVEEYADNITWIHGRHTVVVGADMQFWQDFRQQNPYSPHGQLTFNGQFSGLAGELPGTSGISDLADLELGYPALASHSINYADANQVGGTFWSWYGQDNIHVSQNLSINIGLRYEYRRPPRDTSNVMVTFFPTAPAFSGPGDALLVTSAPDAVNDALCTSPLHTNLISATGECLVASSQQRTQFGFTGRTRQTLIFPTHNDFAPRLGIAWRPTHSDRVVIRTGVGIFYDLGNLNINQYYSNNPVFSPSGIYNTAFGAPPPLTNGVPTTTENIFASGIPPLSEEFSDLYVQPNYQPPRVLEWSFGVQSQLTANMGLEVNYVGTAAHHLDIIYSFGNQPEPGVGNLQPRRPYPDFNILTNFSSTGNSDYEALQVKLTRRLSGGLSLLTSYTWGKTMSDDDGNEYESGNDYPQDFNNVRANWGVSAYNVPQRLVISPIWEIPLGKGRKYLSDSGVAARILGGWEVTSIFGIQSGFPFTVMSPQDFSNTGSSSPRPDRTCSGTNGPQTVAEWFNVNCFTIGALEADLTAGTPRFGNSGRNILESPRLTNLDFGLLRNFALSDRFKLQFRAESFNITNTPPFGAPNYTLGTTGFGALTSAGNPRDVQFALKLVY